MVAGLSAVAAAVVLHFIARLQAWQLLAVAATVFAVAFLASRLLVKRFVQERVELIHRTVHEARSGRGSAGAAPPPDLARVGEEVGAWAEEKRREVAELKERERFRREFIGNLAHELRTPIFSVQGYILTLLEGGLEDPKVNRTFLERANAGTDRMIRIIEDLDVIARLESGVLAVETRATELRDVVENVIHDLRKAVAARGIQLDNGVAEGLLVDADPDRLAQVFSNLLGNAVHYGREGGMCTVRAHDLGGQVLVEVEDDGPGIAAEHLPRLFERFYRVGASRARHEGGSGLGLAIAKHIVEAHQGTISVHSTEGSGTVFSFTLPRADG